MEPPIELVPLAEAMEPVEVWMKTGVSVMTASTISSDPTPWLDATMLVSRAIPIWEAGLEHDQGFKKSRNVPGNY